MNNCVRDFEKILYSKYVLYNISVTVIEQR